MIAVENDLAIRDVGHPIDDEILVLGAFRRAFELHADGEFLGKIFPRFDLDEVGVVIAKGFVGLQLDLDRFTDSLALERLLDLGEDVVVAAVQDDGFSPRPPPLPRDR